MLPIGRIGLYTLLVALPVAVEIPSDPDSAATPTGATRVSAFMGAGTYSLIERGCEGEVVRSRSTDFRDVAGAIEHEFPNGFVVGVRGGTLEEKKEFTQNYPTAFTIRSERTNSYVNPYIGAEQGAAGIGMGWIFPRETLHGGFDGGPSLHARFGRRDAHYFLLSYMESMPIYSGGGSFEAAIGVHPHRLLDASMGITSLPFSGLGLALKADIRVLPNWSLAGRVRVGGSTHRSWFGGGSGTSQSGAALGISYSTRPPLPVHRDAAAYVARPGDTNADGWRSPLDPKEPGDSPAPPPVPAVAAPAAVAPVVVPTIDDGKYPKYGSYQSLDSLAVPISRTDPVAPDTTIGTVFVATLVARTGEVVETRVIQSVPALDAAAIACVRQWTFRPAIDRGRAVASWVTVPVRFGSP